VQVVYSKAFQRKTHDWAYDNQKTVCLYDEMKVTDKCTFSYGWLQSNKKLPARIDVIVGDVSQSSMQWGPMGTGLKEFCCNVKAKFLLCEYFCMKAVL
jgi:hypothetical protein